MAVMEKLRQRQAAREMTASESTLADLEAAVHAARHEAGYLQLETHRPGQPRRAADTKRLDAARRKAREAEQALERHEAHMVQLQRDAARDEWQRMRAANRLPAGGKTTALPSPPDADASLVPLKGDVGAAVAAAQDLRHRLGVARQRSLVDPEALSLGSEVVAADAAVVAAQTALSDRERELRAAYVSVALPIYRELTERLAEHLKKSASLNDDLSVLCDVLGPIAPGGLPVAHLVVLQDDFDTWLRHAREANLDV